MRCGLRRPEVAGAPSGTPQRATSPRPRPTRRIDCWAFPEPEREAYDQVVLLGYREAEVFLDGYAEERIHQWAAGEAPELGPRRYPLYVATATPAGDVLFATRTIDPVAAAEEARSSGLWASAAGSLLAQRIPSRPPGANARRGRSQTGAAPFLTSEEYTT